MTVTRGQLALFGAPEQLALFTTTPTTSNERPPMTTPTPRRGALRRVIDRIRRFLR